MKIQEITIVDVNKDLVEYIKLDVIDKVTDEHIKYSGLYKKDTVQIQRNRNPGTRVAKFPDIIVVEIYDNESKEKK